MKQGGIGGGADVMDPAVDSEADRSLLPVGQERSCRSLKGVLRIPFAYKRARDSPRCHPNALDSLLRRAQNRSCTNENGSGHDDRRDGLRQDPLRCLPGDVLHQAGRGRRVRPLRQSRRPTGTRRSACFAGADCIAWRTAGAVPDRRRLGRQDRSRTGRVRHRDRRRHDLSRLQAGALHRVLGDRWRRYGHGRH